MDLRHWTNPEAFDPDRFKLVPTSADNDEAKAKAAGLARCPFSKESFPIKDGRNGEIANSAYGAVYGVIEGKAFPVCDTAGYAPFGFGYRRCAGELLTVAFIKELLRKAWADRLSFVRLDLELPERLPVGPGTVVEDDISFERAT
jgi:cytochrome P450